MLDPLKVWVDQLRALGGAQSYHEGDVKLSNLVGTLTNQVQANPGGIVGILNFNIDAMWSYLDSQFEPIAASKQFSSWNNTQWATILAQAWLDGMQQGSISASHDVDGTWDCSGSLDTATSGSTTSTIPNLSALHSQLYSDLLPIAEGFLPGSGQTRDGALNAVVLMATAFRSAIANAQFICIGWTYEGIDCVQVPITKSAI